MPAKHAPYHHGDLRRALMDALLELTAERGSTGGITLREIARRAGVSHNAPYRHFADRDEILAAVAEEGFADLDAALRAARDGVADPEDRFIRTGLAYLRFAHARPGHLAAMYSHELPKGRTPELQRAANQTFQVLKELAIDAGHEDVATTRRLGVVAWSFVHGLATLSGGQQIARSVGASADSLAKLGLQHFFRSFTASAREGG